MLTLHVPESQWWDEYLEEFRTTKAKTIQLEHSLISISKWEAKWKKAFLSGKTEDMTVEQTLDYIKCMTLTQSVDENVYLAIMYDQNLIKMVRDYIDDTMTATVINRPQNDSGPMRKRETITSEVIYYWMIKANVPVEFQKWHLNRLLTLIEVIGVKDEQAQAKMNTKRPTGSQLRNRASLNAQRRAKARSRG